MTTIPLQYVGARAVYSQCDPRWSWKRLGDSRRRFYHHGCLVTCLAMILGTRPDVLNQKLKLAGAFDGANLRSAHAADVLGLAYFGFEEDLATVPPFSIFVREVNHDRGGTRFVRHFVVQAIGTDGRAYLLDPYGGKRRNVDYYPFASYRLFARPDDPGIENGRFTYRPDAS